MTTTPLERAKHPLDLPFTTLSPAEEKLQGDIRTFLKSYMGSSRSRGLGVTCEHDPTFSEELARRGWVGMSIPAAYGGPGGSAVERFIVAEELLAAGAPIAAHWIADRQSAQLIERFGTEEQRQRFLPEIAAGKCFFSIGLSEADAGSDLAAVRTTATETGQGWLINGTKLWTTSAHLNHFIIVLARTDATGSSKSRALSQFIVSLDHPSVHVRPIVYQDGSHDFNEVTFDAVEVDHSALIGEVGNGWSQAASELALERSGPDRYLSTFALLDLFCERQRAAGKPIPLEITALLLQLRVLRSLSLAVARTVDEGRSPIAEAALLKNLGTAFEQEVVATVQRLLGTPPDLQADQELERLVARALLVAPCFTIRGGTTEILRSIVARAIRRDH